VRVWVEGMPGGDETEVVAGRISELREDGAVLTVDRAADRPEQRLWVVPHEPGWGFHALWFSFISVDVFELEGSDERPERSDRLGRWFIRLGTPR
jgi:hypothetical protein